MRPVSAIIQQAVPSAGGWRRHAGIKQEPARSGATFLGGFFAHSSGRMGTAILEKTRALPAAKPGGLMMRRKRFCPRSPRLIAPWEESIYA
jgi:hypothetical protein